MRELDFLLQDISDEERKEALLFYENYFDEAGEDNEQKIIQELGSPSRIAAIIKDGLKGRFDESIHSSNQGFFNENYDQNYAMSEHQEKTTDNILNRLKEKWNQLEKRDRHILLILLLIACVPFTFSLLSGVFSGGFAIITIICMALFGFWIVTFACYVIVFALFISGLFTLFHSVGGGLILIGLAFLALAIAKILSKISLSISSSIGRSFSRIFHKESA